MREIQKACEDLKAKTCCVAGHSDIPDHQIEYVRERLKQGVERAIDDGYIHFLTDFTEGTDQLFAEVVAELREKNNTLRLEAVLPYRARYDELLHDKNTHPLIITCADVCFSSEEFSRNCWLVNRREQVRRSSRMIVVFDGRDAGGTVQAIRIAHAQEIKIREIPLGL